MPPNPDRSAIRDIRALSRSLRDASDAQVARAVAEVDRLPQRGDADRLLEPLRPRLARLRPPRPLRFARLLFLPLQPLIVPSHHWQPTGGGIPRAALMSLAATVHSRLGEISNAVEAVIRNASMHDEAVVYRAGTMLWPQAAALLVTVPPPVGWADTGWGPGLYALLARRVGAVLSHAVVIQDLAAEAQAGIAPPRREPVAAMLAEIAAHGPEALAMLVHLLLARLPSLAPLLPDLAAEQGPPVEAAVRQAVGEAFNALLSSLEEEGSGGETALPAWDLTDAVQELRRRITLLNQLSRRPDLPQGRIRVQAVRQRLDAGCRQLFSDAVATAFLPALRDGTAAAGLEATARRLRELESEARALGGAETYDQALRAAAGAVRAQGTALSKATRARLVEILAGPEAALAMLMAVG
jgi:hypothetical protein